MSVLKNVQYFKTTTNKYFLFLYTCYMKKLHSILDEL
ncbi:hypothetical protein CLV59_105191 [Chitinophaga dinghuensis]|uniref:Uncharacterized protein n=1 Tax=Chitinophaga dinghuensis TaxID=1539050 RepID=A0A327VZ47_9BACT|nr:hypothetical protein CLV59_105191 [Chitinophaga dinghuensis]